MLEGVLFCCVGGGIVCVFIIVVVCLVFLIEVCWEWLVGGILVCLFIGYDDYC